MARTVTIGCKLPHGIVIEHPADPAKAVTLNGLNKTVIIGATYATTEVDGDFWDAWKNANKGSPFLESGAVFEGKTAADLAAVARETAKQPTGFEPMAQDGTDIRAPGVKPSQA